MYTVATSSVDWSASHGWHDIQRVGQLAVLVVLAVVVTASSSFSRHLVHRIAGMPRAVIAMLATALAIGLISALHAVSVRWALLEWALMFLVVLLVFAVAAARNGDTGRSDSALVTVVLVTILAHVILAVVRYAGAAVENVPLDTWILFTGFSNLRFFGQFQTLTLPIVVVPLLCWRMSAPRRIGVGALAAVWWMLSIASGTRGTWLGIGVAAVILSVFCVRQAAPWLRMQAMAVIAGALAYAAAFMALPRVLGLRTALHGRFDSLDSLSGREMLWGRAVEYISQHPWLGIGPMHFAMFDNGVGAHPHSSVLQWAAEWGLPSAVLVILVAMMGIVAMVKGVRRIDAPLQDVGLRVGVCAAIIASGVQSLVDGVIVMPYTQVLLAVMCGWALSIHHDRSIAASVPAAVVHAVRGVVVLCAAILAWGVYPEIGRLSDREQAFQARHPGLLMPRFWQQGWIYE